MNKNGFTLAEVLITLAIIGVVAAITLPLIILKTQKQEYIAGLKRSYANVSQVLVKMTNDLGCGSNIECTGLFDTSLSQEDANIALGKELAARFNVSKNCKTDETTCFPSYVSKEYDGQNRVNEVINGYSFVTNDGVSYVIINDQGDCENDYYSSGSGVQLKNECAHVYMDTNGIKKPNSYGRDIFLFYITNGNKGVSLYPAGGESDVANGHWKTDVTCTPTDKTGITCAGRVFEEGWDITY